MRVNPTRQFFVPHHCLNSPHRCLNSPRRWLNSPHRWLSGVEASSKEQCQN
ncbi:hypothetical protein IQ265_09020 [Nodosilinea sp. LEGE 06152]|uniref:hypothetical protein n=1 Tax=Nodosilinea sp. LEGE 06152 TaxID=2777966 RepID=UPI00187F4750|nr:hypothetical protein [Nodosilinea sp. LEGE 06152]MBE9156968.1 hypothetical protein [Nodosilinea sp. LEGE 06152]